MRKRRRDCIITYLESKDTKISAKEEEKKEKKFVTLQPQMKNTGF